MDASDFKMTLLTDLSRFNPKTASAHGSSTEPVVLFVCVSDNLHSRTHALHKRPYKFWSKPSLREHSSGVAYVRADKRTQESLQSWSREVLVCFSVCTCRLLFAQTVSLMSTQLCSYVFWHCCVFLHIVKVSYRRGVRGLSVGVVCVFQERQPQRGWQKWPVCC